MPSTTVDFDHRAQPGSRGCRTIGVRVPVAGSKRRNSSLQRVALCHPDIEGVPVEWRTVERRAVHVVAIPNTLGMLWHVMQFFWKTPWPRLSKSVVDLHRVERVRRELVVKRGARVQQVRKLGRIDLRLHERADVPQPLGIGQVVEPQIAVLSVREHGVSRGLDQLAHPPVVEEAEREHGVDEAVRFRQRRPGGADRPATAGG